jgi:uncharacterized protein (DUF1800 family)
MSTTLRRQGQGPSRPRAVTRRDLLALGSFASAFWGARVASAAPPDTPADVDPSSLLVRLVGRCTMGITEAEVNLAQSLGYEGYLERHLDYTAIDDSAVETRLANQTLYPTLTMTYQQMLTVQAGQCANECMEAAIIRNVFSTRQLFERMVEFWTDHFNIDITGEVENRFKAIDDRDVIRPNALGTFPALLSASAHSPAMLYYLNNDVSTAGNPNENYARELMELHTLGVDGGYTQQDVREVARCFTGWRFYRDNAGAQAGTFRYDSTVHDTGQKTVLGNIIPARSAAAGLQDGIDVLNILVNHPSTASYVSGKLCRWLLGPDVPSGVIQSVAGAYTATGGDIRAMVRAALRPNHLAAASLKYKRPWHQFISAMRAVPTTITSTTVIRSRLVAAGNARFAWPTPDGYPDALDFWVGLVMPRWNFGADLMNSGIAGVSVDTAAFFSGLTTADQMANKINTAMFGGEMPAAERNRIRDYLLPNTPTLSRQREALGLAMGAPSFQWY